MEPMEGIEPAASSTARSAFWGDRPDSHWLRSGSQPDGSSLCLRPPRKDLVRLEGIEPSFFAYRASGLPLTYRRMEGETGSAPAISSLATRRLAARLLPRRLAASAGLAPAWPGSKSGILRLDDEAVVQGWRIALPIPKARVLQTRSDPTRQPLRIGYWWTRGESNSHFRFAGAESFH